MLCVVLSLDVFIVSFLVSLVSLSLVGCPIAFFSITFYSSHCNVHWVKWVEKTTKKIEDMHPLHTWNENNGREKTSNKMNSIRFSARRNFTISTAPQGKWHNGGVRTAVTRAGSVWMQQEKRNLKLEKTVNLAIQQRPFKYGIIDNKAIKWKHRKMR